ncbi:C40 family peptidase [Sinomicrobium soli]|uniref:C40 family peptidase n=1 Tax=Sinomicrobium sp. N-1-3-6 TaxID=2219864 RepID=UPI001374A1E7|nr:NlpC/P60 family protein [Sinomicrobium sp. N-1-3-6]
MKYIRWMMVVFAVVLLESCGAKKDAAYMVTDPYVNAELGRKPGLSDIKVIRDLEIVFEEEEEEPELISEEQKRYFARKLGVPASEITNQKLYAYIVEWEGVPYLYGGNSKSGIDCSALMKNLYSEVYNVELPRTASEIMLHDDQVQPFRSVEYLQEGDLVFFRSGKEKVMTHVGIYLGNMKFLSATESKGVQITSLKDPYWHNSYRVSGRVKSLVASQE